MKTAGRYLVVVLALVLCFTATTMACNANYEVDMSNVQNGALPNDWSILSGQWDVVNDGTEKVLMHTTDSGGIILYLGEKYDKFQMTARVKCSDAHFSKYAGLVFGSDKTDIYYRLGLELNSGDYSKFSAEVLKNVFTFEDGSLEGWAYNAAEPEKQILVTDEESHSGRYSALTIRSSEDTAGYWTAICKRFAIDSNTDYKVSYWLKQEGANQLHSRMAYFAGSNFINIEMVAQGRDGTYSWQKFDGVVSIPKRITDAEFQLMHINPASGVGQVWLDDVEVVKATEDNVGGVVRLDKGDSRFQQLISTANYTIEPGKWYWLRLSVDNELIVAEISYDGKTYEEMGFAFLQDGNVVDSGYVGFYAGAAGVCFADVSISPLD